MLCNLKKKNLHSEKLGAVFVKNFHLSLQCSIEVEYQQTIVGKPSKSPINDNG